MVHPLEVNAMSPIRHFCQAFLLFSFMYSLPAIAAPATTEVTARIRIMNDYMIVVPVTINGSGPYDFVLDTGTSSTMLDQRLADDLGLRRLGATTALTPWGPMPLSVVHANSLSIAGATLASEDLLLQTYVKLPGLLSKVRGILGEDFLRNFDVLIDYRSQVIQLESGPGSMAETLRGEHLPVEENGAVNGESTGCLVVTGRIRELGDNSLSLLIDSGVNNLMLFRENLGVGARRQTFVNSDFISAGLASMETRIVQRLSLGKREVYDLLVVAISGHPYPDVDGLIPTSLFHSIFISHREGFVILNPSFPKASREGSGHPVE